MNKKIIFALIALSLIAAPAHAAPPFMEDMTWQEIKGRIQSGEGIAIVPTGGTEQNGPHLITGKHNVIMRYTAAEIAKKLGTHALVAPVIAYVPEGRIDPPEGHMRFPGTLSLTDETFEHLLEDTARSLKAHGFHLICFIGDHGGSQDVQKKVAEKLTREFAADRVRVLHVSRYYENNGQEKWLDSIGVSVPDPGAHAGLIDTSELMALQMSGVRDHLRGARSQSDYYKTGAMGDSTKASALYGRKLLKLKIDAAAAQIKNAQK